MPVTGTVRPIENVSQGIQVIDGVATMLEDGDNRWVYMTRGDILYLNTEDFEIIVYH